MQTDDPTILNRPQIKVSLVGFIKAPKALIFEPTLSPTDKLIYLALRSHLFEKKFNKVYPSNGRLRLLLRCSKSTVTRSIKRLKRAGYIDYSSGKKGRSNEYHFIEPIGSSMSRQGVTQTPRIGAPMTPQSESVKKNNEVAPPYLKLFHGGDQAFIEEDESITILSSVSRERLKYSWGDDESFRYGPLRGIEALDAARAQFKKRNPGRTWS
jgi:DNA-binding MarR family transcriptional regulator